MSLSLGRDRWIMRGVGAAALMVSLACGEARAQNSVQGRHARGKSVKAWSHDARVQRIALCQLPHLMADRQAGEARLEPNGQVVSSPTRTMRPDHLGSARSVQDLIESISAALTFWVL